MVALLLEGFLFESCTLTRRISKFAVAQYFFMCSCFLLFLNMLTLRVQKENRTSRGIMKKV